MGAPPFVIQDDPGFFDLPEIPEEFLGKALFLFQEDGSVFDEALLLPVSEAEFFLKPVSTLQMERVCRVSFHFVDVFFFSDHHEHFASLDHEISARDHLDLIGEDISDRNHFDMVLPSQLELSNALPHKAAGRRDFTNDVVRPSMECSPGHSER